MRQCPSWSKEPDLRSGALMSAWVRTPPDAFKHFTHISNILMECLVIDTLKKKGPMTVKRISKTMHMSKALVRGILFHSEKTCRVDRAPMCRRKRPMWSYSETKIRPMVRKSVPTEASEDE